MIEPVFKTADGKIFATPEDAAAHAEAIILQPKIRAFAQHLGFKRCSSKLNNLIVAWEKFKAKQDQS